MTISNQRSYIKTASLHGKNPTEIHGALSEVYGEFTVDHSKVSRWANRFHGGCVSTDNDPRPGFERHGLAMALREGTFIPNVPECILGQILVSRCVVVIVGLHCRKNEIQNMHMLFYIANRTHNHSNRICSLNVQEARIP